MVPSWMWFLRRSDAYIKNEWSNYTNYNYEDEIPSNVTDAATSGNTTPATLEDIYLIGPSFNSDQSSTNIKISGTYNVSNIRDILTKFAIIFDGKYRENEFDGSVYNTIEKYRTCRRILEK